MGNRFEVAVGAGSTRSAAETAARFPHRWTPGGVTVEADFTGAHLLHLATAGVSLTMCTGKLRPWESDCRASA